MNKSTNILALLISTASSCKTYVTNVCNSRQFIYRSLIKLVEKLHQQQLTVYSAISLTNTRIQTLERQIYTLLRKLAQPYIRIVTQSTASRNIISTRLNKTFKGRCEIIMVRLHRSSLLPHYYQLFKLKTLYQLLNPTPEPDTNACPPTFLPASMLRPYYIRGTSQELQ